MTPTLSRMRRLLSVFCLLTGLTLAQSQSQTAPAPLTIRFLDVGQGDAVLITAPEGDTLLYDGGPGQSRLRQLIRQYDLRRLDAVVASHADSDHITGLIPAVALFKPQVFLNNGLASTTQTWASLLRVVQLAGTSSLRAQDGQVIRLGSVRVVVLAPPPGMPDTEQNLNSVGLLLQYGSFRALMTGDSEHAETQAWMLRLGSLGPVDVYKAIHHGSLNGDTLTWLRAVRPSNVVVSVGKDNPYGHPTAQALTIYRLSGANTYRTDLNGTVTVTVQPSGQYVITTERGTFTPGQPTAQPARPSPTIPGAPVSPSPGAAVYYANCEAVRAAGKAPLLRGQPGYRSGLDRDGDGRACE